MQCVLPMSEMENIQGGPMRSALSPGNLPDNASM